jgi:hypothetical protein
MVMSRLILAQLSTIRMVKRVSTIIEKTVMNTTISLRMLQVRSWPFHDNDPCYPVIPATTLRCAKKKKKSMKNCLFPLAEEQYCAN